MMCLERKDHYYFLILEIVVVTIIISSFPPMSLCIYPLPYYHLRNYTIQSAFLHHHHHQYQNKVKRSYNYMDDMPISVFDDHVKQWGQGLFSRALARTSYDPSVRVVVSVDDYFTSLTTDDTLAFREAWKEACSTRGGVFLVPKNKIYRVKQINFSGPCHSHFTIKILGTVEASVNISDYKDRMHWLAFENIRNFQVQGGGTLDGMGHIWWQNSCKVNKTLPCQHAPTAVTFIGCKNFRVDGLRIRNAQQMHLSFQKCDRVRASNLVINAPRHSPNTDGIHVTQTRNILITNSLIQTGDDCISIVSGSKNVEAKGISCGPGHGISIGSLGKGQSKAHVSNVLINKATISGTSNGVRIKTWQGGRGYAKNIVFENIVMRNVSNPIIIDQHYCDQSKPCPDMKWAVQVKNVVYKNIKGTSASQVAIKLDCSKRHKCGGIVLDNVNLARQAGSRPGDKQVEAKAECHNVHYFLRGKVSPTCFPVNHSI